MKKALLVLLLFLFPSLCFASYRMNPFDHHLDYYEGSPFTRLTADVVSADAISVDGVILANTAYIYEYIMADNFSDSSHYTGFIDQTSTAISWDDVSYTLTLTAANDIVWVNGRKITFNTMTKQLSVAQEAATALYWFWLTSDDIGTLTLNCSSTHPGWGVCVVASVYWNTTTSKGVLSDERHWFGRDKQWHDYTHDTIGARYSSGLAGTFTDTTLTIAAGVFFDEDIEHTIAEETNCKVLYHNGDADWAWDVLTTPYKVVNPGVDNTLQFNNGNALASVDNNKYVNYWVFITADTSEPVHIVIGTAQYATIALARVATLPSLGALPSAEEKIIYKITYQNSGGTPDYIETTDYRSSSNLPETSYVATDHGSLAGLTDDDHTQYLLANGTRGLAGDWNAGNYIITTQNLLVSNRMTSDVISADAVSADAIWLREVQFPTDTPADNEIIKWDAALGRLNFEADVDTTYTAGDHITLTGTDFDVDDDFLLNNGDTGTGAYNFGEATDFEVENGANPTVDTAGEIAVDTSALSDDALRFYGSAQRTLPAWESRSFVITTPLTDSDFPIFKAPFDMTIQQIHVLCQGGTSVAGQLYECDKDATVASCSAVDSAITSNALVTALDDGSLSNATIDKGDWISWDTTAVTGVVSAETVVLHWTWDAVN